MNRHLKVLFIGLFALLPLETMAEDKVTGTWNSSFKTPRGPMKMSFKLEVKEDNSVEGFMINPIAGSIPLADGITDGRDVSFKVKQDGPFGLMVICYDGHVDGDLLFLVETYEGKGAPNGSETHEATREESSKL